MMREHPFWARLTVLHPMVMDAAVAGVLLVVALVAPVVSSDPGRWTPGALLLCVVMFVALPFARSRPLPVLVLLIGGFLLAQARYDLPREFSLPVLAAVYLGARYSRIPRSARLLGTIGIAVCLDASTALTATDGWRDSRYLMIASWTLLVAAVGDALRNRSSYLRSVEERARQAEHARDLEAQRRVTEERLRIAREVHDLVAHHIAVVSVQAGVAEHLFDRDKEASRQALGQVREAASSVLHELGGLLGLLRGSGPAELSREPSPDVSDIPHLLESLEAAGLAVRWEQFGTPGVLPAALELTAFRLLQESLTNAHKHGDGSAHVVVSYHDDGLDICVENRVGCTPATAGGGYGLVGMSERVGAVGGTLSAAQTADGRFLVQARLPATSAESV
jgi:signal transduction histidine kinase